MDASRVADRYISRAGGPVNPTREQLSSDLVTVSNFIIWHDDGHLMGGVRKREAWLAFCRLMNIEPHKVEAIIRPQPTDPG